MEVVEISDTQLEAIKERPEGHFSDFKSKKILPKSACKTLIAFANADGGEVFIGLEDEKSGGEWDGFDKPELANGHIQAIDGNFPLGVGVSCTFLSHKYNKGYLLHVEVQKSRDIIRIASGDIYVRRGPRNHKVTVPSRMIMFPLGDLPCSWQDRF